MLKYRLMRGGAWTALVWSLSGLTPALANDVPQVRLEGRALDLIHIAPQPSGDVFVDAAPIFKALGHGYVYDASRHSLTVTRAQDKAEMRLDVYTGMVYANEQPVGTLKTFGQVGTEHILLTPNAIDVLAGTAGKYNAEARVWNFEIDPRLKLATGFEILVNGVALGTLDDEPRAIGPVLLLPLLPIAEALGHEVTRIDERRIEVRRAQDSSVFQLNLETGLVALHGRPFGVSRNTAYIDGEKLLLPATTLETLTGTHVSVQDGRFVNIDLDDRLSGAVQPQGRVGDMAAQTPLTPERLDFHIGTDTVNTVSSRFRLRGLSAHARYETPDLPERGAEFGPSWASIDFRHVNGLRGSIGDYAAHRRELDGVDVVRLRGVSVVTDTEKGRWVFLAGTPQRGSQRISDDQSRLRFGGTVGGARYASNTGWEAGVAARHDGRADDTQLVASALTGRVGRKRGERLQWELRGYFGVFDGPAREDSVDGRGSVAARYRISETVSINISAEYDGAEFLRGITEDPADVQNDATRLETVLRYAPKTDVGPFAHPVVSVRASHRDEGVFKHTDADKELSLVGAALSTEFAPLDMQISGSASRIWQRDAATGTDGAGWHLDAQAHKRLPFATMRARYSYQDRPSATGDLEAVQNAALNVTAHPYEIALPKAASLKLAPSATLGWNGEETNLRAGLIAHASSGNILGSKTRVDASLGVLQSMNGVFEDGAGQNQFDKFLTVSVARWLKLGKNMALGVTYRNDLEGDHRVGVQLNGHFDFNAPRRYEYVKEGRGVLKGQVFLDANRDGVKQDDEVAVARVVVSVKRTPLSLRTDRDGYFTIQNIKEGLYEVGLRDDSLPLGLSLPDDFMGRVTIRENFITDINLPVVQRGQISGFVFTDSDGDGLPAKGDDRRENLKLLLRRKDGAGEEAHIYTARFGQFAFDDLDITAYEILEAGKGRVLADIDLAEHEKGMAQVKLAVPLNKA